MNAALIVAAFALVWVAVVAVWVGAMSLGERLGLVEPDADDRSRGMRP